MSDSGATTRVVPFDDFAALSRTGFSLAVPGPVVGGVIQHEHIPPSQEAARDGIGPYP